MKRIRIEVTGEAAGWRVAPLLADPAGTWIPLLPAYPMERAVTPGGRSLPRPPADGLPSAAADHAGLCSGDLDPLTRLLDRLARREPEPGDVRNYGRWLFDSLLAPAWTALEGNPDTAHTPLELALCWSADSSLHRLTWEAMHDGVAPVVSHPAHVVAVTRLVGGGSPAPAQIEGIPRVLFAIGAPLADPTIRPGAMYMGLLKSLDTSGRCRSRAIVNASIDEVDAACRTFAPHVVHLVAHGELAEDGRGTLLLRGDGGERPADAAALAHALRSDQGEPPLAVVISACHSAGGLLDDTTDVGPLAAQLVAEGIPVVSAVAGEIGERACRYYTRRLAESLHAGQSIVAAAAHGRRAAMTAAGAPTDELDWALPALFLSETVDPAQPLIDTRAVDQIIALGDRLMLRRQPMFVGRQDMLDVADGLADRESHVRVMATVFDRGGEGFGATRLLREIGWRALRAGHIPLLLGPFSPASQPAPRTLRDLVVTMSLASLTVAQKLGRRVFVPSALGLGLDPAAMAALRAEVDDQRTPNAVANAAVRRAFQAMSLGPDQLDDAATVREFLVDDLLALAAAARDWGAPFGPHTRPVLLCDNVHEWAEPATFAAPDRLSALTGLLSMVDGSGLGARDEPVPVVLSGSATMAAGPALRTWLQDANPWTRSMVLGDMSADEAIIGFQWVLLHAWAAPTAANDDRAFTYTANPGQRAGWEAVLANVPRRPDSVSQMLYVAANIGHSLHIAGRNDDENDWRAYAAANGLG